MKELTPTAKKPHVHVRMNVDGDENSYVYRGKELSIETYTNDISSKYQFVEYNKSYAFYKDGATEYIRFEGTLLNDHLKLTLDVFSCYCEPLNENQEPPF